MHGSPNDDYDENDDDDDDDDEKEEDDNKDKDEDGELVAWPTTFRRRGRERLMLPRCTARHRRGKENCSLLSRAISHSCSRWYNSCVCVVVTSLLVVLVVIVVVSALTPSFESIPSSSSSSSLYLLPSRSHVVTDDSVSLSGSVEVVPDNASPPPGLMLQKEESNPSPILSSFLSLWSLPLPLPLSDLSRPPLHMSLENHPLSGRRQGQLRLENRLLRLSNLSGLSESVDSRLHDGGQETAFDVDKGVRLRDPSAFRRARRGMAQGEMKDEESKGVGGMDAIAAGTDKDVRADSLSTEPDTTARSSPLSATTATTTWTMMTTTTTTTTTPMSTTKKDVPEEEEGGVVEPPRSPKKPPPSSLSSTEKKRGKDEASHRDRGNGSGREGANDGKGTKPSSSSSSSSSSPSFKFFHLSSYIDADSILYDVGRGFVLAALLCCLIVLSYRCFLCCCVQCGICPHYSGGGAANGALYSHRRRGRQRRSIVAGKNWYELVGQNDNDDDEEDDDDSVWDDCSSGADSDLSMEYGLARMDNGYFCDNDDDGDDGVQRFSEVQINRAAQSYFDRDERQNKDVNESESEKLQAKTRASSYSCADVSAQTSVSWSAAKDEAKSRGRIAVAVASSSSSSSLSLSLREGKGTVGGGGGSGGGGGGGRHSRASSSILDGDDEDDLPPLDLEMIERKAAEEIGEDGADLMQRALGDGIGMWDGGGDDLPSQKDEEEGGRFAKTGD